MRILKITDQEHSELDEHFEESESVELEELTPEVSGEKSKLVVNDKPVSEYDAVYADIPVESAIFGRVLLEIIEEKGIALNYSSTAFFTMSKKNYLYHVLKEKGLSSPKTAVVADEKAARNLENHLKGPLVAKRFNGLSEAESTKIDTVESIYDFAEGVEYGEQILIFNELRKGKKYRCLVTGDTIISLKDDSEGWRVTKESLKYSSLSSDLRQIVGEAADALGTNTAEILLRDGKIVDANPNPDLEMYTAISGKDAYSAVAEALKGDAQ